MRRIALALLALLAVACTASKSSPEGASKSLFVFYNNDNIGYLEPCGCRVSPVGGMHRRWNAMRSYPQGQRLFVDAGNMLFKSTAAADYLAPQWYEQAVGVIEAYNMLGADAAAPGETDFALGVKKFQELAKKADFPFLAANVFWRGKPELFLKDSLIVEKAGKKIGIFGVVDPSMNFPAELEIRDPFEASRKAVEKLKSRGAEMIVALSHSGYDNDLKLAEKIRGIDLIVGAHSQSLLQKPDKVGETTIVQLSSQGQMLGLLEYSLDAFPRKITASTVAELDAGFDNTPNGEANPMKNLMAVTNLRMTEANRKLDERLWQAHEGVSVGYETFLSCRDCHETQAHFQEGKNHAAAFLTLLSFRQEKNLDCVKCHSVGLGEKGGFRSMKDAFLDANNNPVDLEEIRKHAGSAFPEPDTEYRKNVSRIRPDVAHWIEALKKAGVKKSFVSVQCETCHGTLPGHPFAQAEGAGFKKVVSQTCVQCHTPSQMPAWYDSRGKLKLDVFGSALKSVSCPR